MSEIIQKRAHEFAEAAFGPFGVDTAPYAAIIAELIEGAFTELEAENARLRAENDVLRLPQTSQSKRLEAKNARLCAALRDITLDGPVWRAQRIALEALERDGE